jgi:UDP-N-acetylmuramate--alanine ligase
MGSGGLDPTFIVGGQVNSVGTNSKLGEGQYLVAEADESDASFLHLQPIISVVTNIDADHLTAYENDFEKLRSAFVEFLHNIPFYGLAVLCIDNDVVRSIIPEIARPYVTYGFSDDADLYAKNISYDKGRTTFEVIHGGTNKSETYSLSLPGKHNVLNALASIVIGMEFDISSDNIARALDQFAGIGRRMQPSGVISLDKGQVDFIDDYAHHPQEIAATVDAVRKGWPGRRLVTVFQPHRYSRTRDLFDDFVNVLSEVDVLLLLGVYAAGEAPVNNADSRALASGLRLRGKLEAVVIEDNDELATILSNIILPDDIVLTLGAGSIGKIASGLCDQVSAKGAWL